MAEWGTSGKNGNLGNLDTGNQYRTSAGTGRFVHNLSPPPWDKAGVLLEFWEIKFIFYCAWKGCSRTPRLWLQWPQNPTKKRRNCGSGIAPQAGAAASQKNLPPSQNSNKLQQMKLQLKEISPKKAQCQCPEKLLGYKISKYFILLKVFKLSLKINSF